MSIKKKEPIKMFKTIEEYLHDKNLELEHKERLLNIAAANGRDNDFDFTKTDRIKKRLVSANKLQQLIDKYGLKLIVINNGIAELQFRTTYLQFGMKSRKMRIKDFSTWTTQIANLMKEIGYKKSK